MSVGIFLGYVALSAFFYCVFEMFYSRVPLRLIFILAVSWPVALIVIAFNELVDFITSAKDD